MSTLITRAPRGRRSPACEGKPNLSAVDPRDRWTRTSQRSKETRNGRCPESSPESYGCLDEMERVGLRALLCEMLVTSVWEEGDGHAPTEGKNRDEDHNSAART
jgi:hypothetical protein